MFLPSDREKCTSSESPQSRNLSAAVYTGGELGHGLSNIQLTRNIEFVKAQINVVTASETFTQHIVLCVYRGMWVTITSRTAVFIPYPSMRVSACISVNRLFWA